MVALRRAIRGTDASSIKVEVVTAKTSRAPNIISPAQRPSDAFVANAPKSTSRVTRINMPAAHEVKRGSYNVIVYTIGDNR